MKARMELVVGASAAQQRATSRLQCRQRAHSLLSCQTWTGFYQHQFLLLPKWFKIYLFSYRAIKTFGIKTLQDKMVYTLCAKFPHGQVKYCVLD